MIRMLFGSALPILGLGVATALLGPDLVTGPRGEPLVVTAPPAATLQNASFDGASCAFPLSLDGTMLPTDPALPGTHVVTLAFHHDANGGSMTIASGVAYSDADAALVLVFDDEGRIVAVTQQADCLGGNAKPASAGI